MDPDLTLIVHFVYFSWQIIYLENEVGGEQTPLHMNIVTTHHYNTVYIHNMTFLMSLFLWNFCEVYVLWGVCLVNNSWCAMSNIKEVSRYCLPEV